MQIDKKDLELLTRLKLKNIIDLALFLPKKIENYTLSSKPSENFCTQEVLIKSIRTNQSSRTLSGVGYCEAWGIDVAFVFFNPSKWHYALLKPNSKHNFYAKLSLFNGLYSFQNPKILSKTNCFCPKYQIQGVKDEKIAVLIQRYINENNLKAFDFLEQKHINLILNLHKYDEHSVFILENLEQFKNEFKFIEIANFLSRLRKKKQVFKSYDIELFDISKWLESLPFKPTLHQQNAIADIKKDLSSNEAKRRIIMGDVGCGKSLVILAAALMVYPKQAILMSPTTILAKQLYEQAQQLLPSFMDILFLKGGKKEKNLDERLKKANLVIGTQALIHLEKHNAVLVMIDEQHRFGSKQRQKINDLAKAEGQSPHFLQFSATPIPRTLSMLQSELISFSFIKQMPFKKDIQTICLKEENFKELESAIKKELSEGKQVAIIYPLVEKSEALNYLSLNEAKNYWLSRYEDVFVVHGKDKEKDEILEEFAKNGKILLATTVIEVGISLPRLSTIVIVGAERLGLATLHQLRGRVGRVGLKSYCYLYTKLKELPQRLLDFSKTLDGFKIAELDLKNRLSGDLLDGSFQHGNEFKFFDFASDEEILKQAKQKLG